MKTSFLYFAIMFVLLQTYAQNIAQENEIGVKISIEKNIYHLDELIVVKLKFTNNDTTNFRIEYNCSLERDILDYLFFIDESGYPSWFKESFVVDCFGNHIDIEPSEFYETYGAPISNFDQLPSGRYKLSSKYKNSDTVKFEILKYENDEMYSKLSELRQLRDTIELIAEWRSFLKDNENSIYSDRAFNSLLSLRETGANNRALRKKDIIRFFGSNPDAWRVDVYLFWSAFYIKRNEGDDKMYEFLKLLANKFPNTRVSFIANKIITEKKIPDYYF